MTKIMAVRLVPQILYLIDRLAGRAGRTGRPLAQGATPAPLATPPVTPSPDHRDATGPRGGRWVLPGLQPYTGAEGAEGANLLDFFNLFSCSFGFGSKAWADAR